MEDMEVVEGGGCHSQWRECIIYESCKEFDKVSNGISYDSIELTEKELCLFYCDGVFHIMRNFRFLVHISAHEFLFILEDLMIR